jgi:hypothetical protein
MTEKVDLKKWEALIFSGNANQSEDQYKILKEYISDKKPGNRKVSTFYLSSFYVSHITLNNITTQILLL